MVSSSVPRTADAVRVAALPRQIPTWLMVILVGVLALVPRIFGLADFYTVDEAYHWPARTRAFAQAVLSHDWARTSQTGHPGVTTMWLGSLGYWLAGQIGVPVPGRTGGGATYLALLRLPLAIANSLIVAGGYTLLRRLLAPGTALLAALLWATAPFLVAHSRVLHLDGLLTSCMAMSLLCLLVATAARETDRQADKQTSRQGNHASRVSRLASRVCSPGISHPWALAASGVFAGLALLTKAPGLLILPFAGIWLLLASPRGTLPAQLGWAVARYLGWLGCALLVISIGWPALWVAPREAIMSVVGEIRTNGGQPHSWGNYFMGQPVAAPGWGFYPAVIAWRMTPLALIGLALAPLAIWRRGRERRALLALLGFALFFMLVMGHEPKEFDRYLLPIWPALLILAAAGLAAPFQIIGGWLRVAGLHPPGLATALASCALTVALLAEVLAYQPYTLAYFNPLLGGGAAAPQALLIGWGEGMEQAGAWLRGRPDLGQGAVVARNPPTLEPFLPVRVGDLTAKNVANNANYVVLYISYLQRQNDPELTAQIQQNPPLHTVEINNIPYALIYQMPRPFETPVGAVFGGGVQLRGVTLQRSGDALTIVPSWNVQRDQARQLFVFVHVLDAAGKRVAQIDLPLDARFAQLQAGQQLSSPIPLALPPNLAAGSYRLALGVYDPANGARLALTGASPLPAAIDGPHVVEIAAPPH